MLLLLLRTTRYWSFFEFPKLLAMSQLFSRFSSSCLFFYSVIHLQWPTVVGNFCCGQQQRSINGIFIVCPSRIRRKLFFQVWPPLNFSIILDEDDLDHCVFRISNPLCSQSDQFNSWIFESSIVIHKLREFFRRVWHWTLQLIISLNRDNGYTRSYPHSHL